MESMYDLAANVHSGCS